MDVHRKTRTNYRPQFAKVMFLHLSVSHSVHRGPGRGGGAWSGGGGGYLVPGVPGPRGVPGLGWGVPGPGVPGPGGVPGSGGCLVPGWDLVETPRTATIAGGTHPTGIHSCLSFIS